MLVFCSAREFHVRGINVNRILFSFCAFLVSGLAVAGEPAFQKSDAPAAKLRFVFPQIKPSVDPPPSVPPVPGAVPVLEDGMLYLIPSDEPFILIDSPPGRVKITRKSGPREYTAKFLDGNGKYEDRTVTAKHIAEVRAIAAGRVELIHVPGGAADESQITRMLLDANKASQPPPVIPPGPPEPDGPVVPPAPFVLKSFRVILVYESGEVNTPAANSILSGKAVEEYLNANCTGGKAGWARREKDAVGTYDPARQEVWDAVKDQFQPPINTKTPAAAVQVNDKITVIPFESSPAMMVAKLKEYAEGKHAK